jgi:hypothetical protein
LIPGGIVPLYDDTTLVPSTGHFYTGPVGTPYDEDGGTPWVEIGHTSADEIFAMTSEGGDKTTLATLQSSALRTTTTPRIDKITFSLHQFDTAALKLYFGSNAAVKADGHVAEGLLGVPRDPVPTEVSFLVVLKDGESTFALYAPKAEITRGDDLSIGDTSTLAALPLEVTPLTFNGADEDYYVLPIAHTA